MLAKSLGLRLSLLLLTLLCAESSVVGAQQRAKLTLSQRLKPILVDRDRDAMPDSIEAALRLNPKKADSDGDGGWDGEEKYSKTGKTFVKSLDAGAFDTMLLKKLAGVSSSSAAARATLAAARKKLAKLCTAAGQTNCRLPLCSNTVTRNCRKPVRPVVSPTPAPGATPTARPTATSAPSGGNASIGAVVFQNNCSGCHSASDQARKNASQISSAIRDIPSMAALRLSSSDLANLAAYLNTIR